jgi:hypothetical protein
MRHSNDKKSHSWAPVAHAYNPSFSGDRSGASPVKQSERPYLEKSLNKKIGLVEWFKVKALSSSPSMAKKKEKKKERKGITHRLQTKANASCTWKV